MSRPLRIIIAEDEPELLADLEETLQEFGHQVVGTATNGRELVELCKSREPDLVVSDIKMPDMDGLEAARELSKIRPVPFVIVSAYHDQEYIDRALEENVLAYLIKPVDDNNLCTAIQVARRRFQEFLFLREQATCLQQALEERKLIERAKGILMKRANLDEPAAFRRLQLLSSQRNVKMIDVARTLVDAEQAFASD
jgi:response regulator NasT